MALPLGLLGALAATAIHPHRENVMDNPAVYTVYAQHSDWIPCTSRSGPPRCCCSPGCSASTTPSARAPGPDPDWPASGSPRPGRPPPPSPPCRSSTASLSSGRSTPGPPPEGPGKTAAFAAANALRWTEYSLQSYANILLGLAVGLHGVAILHATGYPRWLGLVAVGSATGWIIHGLMVAHIGLFDSIPRLIAQVLLVVFAAGIAPLMWRYSHARSTADRREPTPTA